MSARLGNCSASFQRSAVFLFFFFLNIKVLLLLWASQLREYTCVRARQGKGTWRLKPTDRSPSIAPVSHLISCSSAELIEELFF